jgi:hypothetical protein
MSLMSHKRISGHAQTTSALPPKSDITRTSLHVRYVPTTDIASFALLGWESSLALRTYQVLKTKRVPV